MHPLFKKADELSHSAIGAAIEVHRLKGPGLIENIYQLSRVEGGRWYRTNDAPRSKSVDFHPCFITFVSFVGFC